MILNYKNKFTLSLFKFQFSKKMNMKEDNFNNFYKNTKYDFSKFLKNTNNNNNNNNNNNISETENISENEINPMYDYTKHSLLKYLYMFGYNKDNIGYILHEPMNKILIGVDFGEFEISKKIVTKLENELNSKLKYILTTHSHHDHSGGNQAWREERGEDLVIVGGNTDTEDIIPYSNKLMNDLETLTEGEFCIACMHTPGHIKSHVCYIITHVTENSTKIPFLFCGDTLFIGGCGRVFNGTHEELYNSLLKISYLNNDTLVFCGHEYTQRNLEFCLKLDPENEFLKDKYEWVIKMRSKNEFTVGSRLIEEKLYNPFLRCGDDYYLALTGESSPEASFKKLRMLKDKF
jgi:hydroxyacylglutathione hydrolase